MIRKGTLMSRIALALGAVIAVASNAQANSIGGFAGKPLDGTPLSCYAESAGAVRGTGDTSTQCTANSERWEVNLPIDRGGTFQMSFWIASPTAGPFTCCAAYVVTPQGSLTSTTPACTNHTSLTEITATSPSVVSQGQLFTACSGLATTSNALGSITWQ
jgi:hypothetical protein